MLQTIIQTPVAFVPSTETSNLISLQTMPKYCDPYCIYDSIDLNMFSTLVSRTHSNGCEIFEDRNGDKETKCLAVLHVLA